ncbi:hypothetical protein [Rhodococcus yananensis]|uniref:hypothetical protein n=1 Tax=Rhodococcus yananensis TaxID=2879464 RepID=UPI001CF7EDC9|nr:hypothetical protein [Rhodococcus yananensis]
MNRQIIVRRALWVLSPILVVGLVYGLPMLGLKLAVDHGLYVAAASAALPLGRMRASIASERAELGGEQGFDYFEAMRRLRDLEPLEVEFIAHSGYTEEQLHDLARAVGREPQQWRTMPLWAAVDVDHIRVSIESEQSGATPDPIDLLEDVVVERGLERAAGLTVVPLRYGDKAVVAFDPHPMSLDGPEIDLEDIPRLIGILSDIHARLTAPRTGTEDTSTSAARS